MCKIFFFRGLRNISLISLHYRTDQSDSHDKTKISTLQLNLGSVQKNRIMIVCYVLLISGSNLFGIYFNVFK